MTGTRPDARARTEEIAYKAALLYGRVTAAESKPFRMRDAIKAQVVALDEAGCLAALPPSADAQTEHVEQLIAERLIYEGGLILPEQKAEARRLAMLCALDIRDNAPSSDSRIPTAPTDADLKRLNAYVEGCWDEDGRHCLPGDPNEAAHMLDLVLRLIDEVGPLRRDVGRVRDLAAIVCKFADTVADNLHKIENWDTPEDEALTDKVIAHMRELATGTGRLAAELIERYPASAVASLESPGLPHETER